MKSFFAYFSRANLLLFFIMLLFTILGVRAMDLQAMQGGKYYAQAENNRFYTQRIPALRGVIFDRYGEPLTLNIQKYFRVEDPKALYGNLVPIEREQALQLLASSESAKVVTAAERRYPYAHSLAHVVGYVGDVTAEDLQRDETLSVGQHIGKAGLEYTYEKILRGRDGEEVFEINALGQKQRHSETVAPQPGQNISSSIDPYVAEVASRALGQHQGAIIISDAFTGEVVALSSWPTFDPNTLSQSFPDPVKEQERKQKIRDFFNDPKQLFFNRAISGVYPPGSTFKIVTALAGLDQQKITNSTQVVDEGVLKVGEFEFGNWYYRQYGRVEGPINLTRAIARSNDIYFYKVAEWVGPDGLATMARMMGLGEKVGIDLPAEARGVVPDPAWKVQVKGEKWFLGDTYHYGIGQGDLLTSPLQVAQFTQAVANNGSLCPMVLNRDNKKQCKGINIKPEDIELVLQGMIGTCSPSGTAFPFFQYNASRIIEGASAQKQIENGAVACKTGTAEFGAADERGYRKTHGWFTSIVEIHQTPEQKENLSARVASIAAQQKETSPFFDITQLSDQELFQLWQKRQKEGNFPRRLVITVLVESDEQNPYKEGSRDAGPIVKYMVDWLNGTLQK
jgi:penicillin-binding protein 2